MGAFLRLWHLDSAMFLNDQSILMTLAREAITLHALPVTGIPSSVGTLNPPFSVYLLVPFAAFGRNPWPAVVALALWNVAGIGITYVFALRHFGRWVAAISALLLATCGAAVDYSRYLWQQNYLAPFLALFGLALFSWCVRGKRGWFPIAVLTLVIAALLHPTAVLLVPVLVMAAVLAPVWPNRWEWSIAIVGVALLLAPSVIWEALTNGSDLQALGQLTHNQAHVDWAAVACLYEVLGRPGTATGFPVAPDGTLTSLRALILQPPHTIFQSHSFYSQLGRSELLIPLAAFGLFLLGWLVLTGGMVLRALSMLRNQGHSCVEAEVVSARNGRNPWQRPRGDPMWRGYVLLWLWVTIPPLALVRHTSPVYPHYLMILYPAAFVVSAIGLDWLVRRVLALGRAVVPSQRPAARLGRALPGVAVGMLVGLLIAGQAMESGRFIASLGTAQYDGPSFDSLPLYALSAADAALGGLQRRMGARAVFVLTQQSRDAALTYMLVADHPGHYRVPDDCLVLPAPAMGPALVVSSRASSAAAQLLSQLPGATHVADLPLPGGEPLQVYRVSAAAATLPGERSLAPLVFRDTAGAGLSLEGVAPAGSGMLRLRWRVLSSTTAGLTQTAFHITLAGGAGGGVANTVACQATAWHAGETLFTWLPIPAGATSAIPRLSATAEADAQVVSVQAETTMPGLHWAGPLRVLGFSTVLTEQTSLSAVDGHPTPASLPTRRTPRAPPAR
jgi:4-amino-4-deoxy-L-arabinose transferase-like glycosyltransferase